VRLEERLQEHPVQTSIPVDLPLVSIDGILIEQVLINLLENAAKYAPSGTPIEVSAEPVPGAVIVTVADHGPGVPPDERERIFEKFYRSPLNSSGSGIGLGLTICRGIITAHGGRIWVEDQPGGGARFRFTLPTDGAPMTALEETVSSPAAS
jgi:two-component system sensor histidine kinase KdpD